MKNLITALLSLTAAAATAAPVEGWLHMRGPLQTGVSLEKQLPDKILTEDALWTADLPGRSTPTVANGRIFVVGHLGGGANLQEGVFCFVEQKTAYKVMPSLVGSERSIRDR